MTRVWKTGFRALALAAVLSEAACEGESEPLRDAGPSLDGAIDAATTDANPSAPDAEIADAEGPDLPGPNPTGPCESDETHISCPHDSMVLELAAGIGREVHFLLPSGEPPAAGWPTVIFFQGSFFSSARTWEAEPGDTFGAFHLVRTFEDLIHRGYAIVAPEAHANGSTFWDTNVPPWSLAWASSPDHQFMVALFGAIEAGDFGPLDSSHMFATGISSGGYMTSRMAVAYPGRFRSLAVHSASYASCSGALCLVPELPADHPPTLFLHGEQDLIVPVSTMYSYAEALDDQGTAERQVVDADAAHEWIPAAVQEVGDWFDAHP